MSASHHPSRYRSALLALLLCVPCASATWHDLDQYGVLGVLSNLLEATNERIEATLSSKYDYRDAEYAITCVDGVPTLIDPLPYVTRTNYAGVAWFALRPVQCVENVQALASEDFVPATVYTDTWEVTSGVYTSQVLTNYSPDYVKTVTSVPVWNEELGPQNDPLSYTCLTTTGHYMQVTNFTEGPYVSQAVIECIDEALFKIIPKHVDMHFVNAAGTFASYFSARQTNYEWEVDAWVPHYFYRTTFPMLTVSNAWRYCNIGTVAVVRTRVDRGALYPKNVSTPGWMVGEFDQHNVDVWTERYYTNAVEHYLFHEQSGVLTNLVLYSAVSSPVRDSTAPHPLLVRGMSEAVNGNYDRDESVAYQMWTNSSGMALGYATNNEGAYTRGFAPKAYFNEAG